MQECETDLKRADGAAANDTPNGYPLKNPNFFALEGRINRAKYVYSLIIIGIIGAVAVTIKPTNPTIVLTNVLLFFPVIKRLHDMDVSGGLGILAFLPGANIILAIVLLFKMGTRGANKYGPDPVAASEGNDMEVE